MSEFDTIPVDTMTGGFGPGAPLNHGAERNRRLRASVVAGVLIKPLALLTPLVITPLYVHYLGKEGFGLFQSIVAMSMLLSLSNVGMQQGLVNRLIDCHVNGNREMTRRYVSSFVFTLAAIIVAVFLVWCAAAALVPWERVFVTKDPGAGAALKWIIWITGAGTLAGLYFCVPIAVYTASQEMLKAYLWDGAYKISVLVVSVAVVFAKFGLIGAAVATTCVSPVVAFFNTRWLYLRRPWLRPRLADFDRSVVRSLLSDGILMFCLQMAVVVMFQCDKTLIGALVSPEAVTPYALLGQLFLLAYGVLLIMIGPMIPAHGEAFRRGDVRWNRRALRLCLLAGFAIVGSCGALLLPCGDRIFTFWTGGTVTHVPANLVLAVTAMFLQRVWVDSHSAILNPANILRPQVRYAVAHVVLNLAAAVALAKPFGVAGIAWATPITGLVTTTWGSAWLVRRALGAKEGHSPSP
jgi:O-antigen/teichoic acid export membrane protein